LIWQSLWGQTEISVSVRDDVGWNPPTRITNVRSNKYNPAILVDALDNVHVVWEDDRYGSSMIMWAQRKNDVQAWLSSGQFGEDTVVMQQYDLNDPYSGGAVNFKHPDLAYDHPNLWLVAEAHQENDHTSVIYRGFRDVDDEVWKSIGVPILNSDGDFLATGSSELISLSGRNCVSPSIAANETLGQMVVVWEDQTEPVNQIWGAAFNNFGTDIESAIQVTSRVSSCTNPAVGFVDDLAAILFQSDGDIFMSSYESARTIFSGSGTGSSDTLIQIDPERTSDYPAIADFVPAKNFKMLYDFLRTQDSTLSALEFPDYYLIGDAIVNHKLVIDRSGVNPTYDIVSSTDSTDMASNIDTKEFAFGDMSENLSLIAHWKDIKFYFGYDARPLTIGRFNSSTVLGWPDDRINDIFVDTFGNLIVATFNGLVYHNVFTGELTKIEGIGDALVTAVKWGGNGAWYVGTASGLFLSINAGQDFQQYPDVNGINDIAIDNKGRAICGGVDGVIIVTPDITVVPETIPIASNLTQVVGMTDFVRTIAIDENNIIWCGTDLGLIRIENKDIFMFFNRKSGMRSSHVTDITIVNKHLRYIATANGIDRMNGTIFSGISTETHSLLNNNISQIQWDSNTNSLWASSLHSLHEIVFKDPHHEVIEDETVQYDSTELLTEVAFNTKVYDVLDIDEIQTADSDLQITSESVSVLINKNPIDFGFSVGDVGRSITFLTELLTGDEVEVQISNEFTEFEDFNQTEIEKKVVGDKRTVVKKIVKTFTKNQNLFLTGADKHQILFFAGVSNLPFTTILLDRDLPVGCFKQINTLTRTTLKFKILAVDLHSGINGYMLSNFENFTTDGDIPQSFSTLPIDGVVNHNIGSGLNNVLTSLSFPDEVTIDLEKITINNEGSALSRWTDIDANITYLYAATSSPPVVWRLDPTLDTWSAIARLDTSSTRSVTEMLEFNNVLFVATGDNSGSGVVYKTVDGINFDVASTTTDSTHFNAMTAALDGTLYFGDGAGNIYDYKAGASTKKFTGIGDEINSLAVWTDTLIAGTGNNGRIYSINLDTGDNLIIFSGNDNDISEVHIKDAFTTSDPLQVKVYAGSGDFTKIYRGNLDTFDFIKSFSSFGKTIGQIITVDKIVLDAEDESGDSQVIAVVGDSLFKHNEPAWEFFYLHHSDIEDVAQYGNPGSEGLYIISNSSITKWTNELSKKTVYLRLKDKAGNVSSAPILDPVCPAEDDDFCCGYAYSINIADLKDFVNEARIVDIDEYGAVQFTYDSPNDRSFYAADEIDEEVGIYTSEIFNGSNDIVSWKTITWEETEPVGTSVDVQIRNGVTKDETEDASWSANLVKDDEGVVSLEHISDQYIQFRAILRSRTRDISPTLTSVTLRNLTTQASHFFTTNFILPSRPIKGIMTANTFIPVSADVVFGINTKNSTDFGDYQIIEPNRVFTSAQGQFGDNFRIGAKLLSPGIPQVDATNAPGDPYDASSYVCIVNFPYTNIDSVSKNFHFRVKFFNDTFRTQLIHTFFSGNDQTGWSFGGGSDNFPANGVSIAANGARTIKFEPIDRVESNQRWYVLVEAHDGSNFETLIDNKSFVCSTCNLENLAGLVSTYYKTGLPETLTSIPKFSSFTPDHTLLENKISFPAIFGNWTTSKGQSLSGYDNNFAIKFRGKIQAPIAGTYTFELQSNDGSKLFINADEIIDHDGEHGYTTASGQAILTEGFHDIEVQYFDGTGEARLELRWITPGETVAVVVPTGRFFHAVVNEYCDAAVVPQILNFAVLFEMENGETVKLNLTP